MNVIEALIAILDNIRALILLAAIGAVALLGGLGWIVWQVVLIAAR